MVIVSAKGGENRGSRWLRMDGDVGENLVPDAGSFRKHGNGRVEPRVNGGSGFQFFIHAFLFVVD